MPKKSKLSYAGKRHRFFLNPYDDCGFTRCPKCDTKTKVRRFPLAIMIDPGNLFLLNKQCKYCVPCDLIITKQSDVESLMADAFEKKDPDTTGNGYMVVGTLDRKDWRQAFAGKIDPRETAKRMFIFEDLWNFKMTATNLFPSETALPKKPNRRSSGKKASESSKTIYEFEIALQDIEPRIWRRFAVAGNMALEDLHVAIQAVMGWDDCHMHSFEIGGKNYDREGAEGGDPFGSPEEILYETDFRIDEVLTQGDLFRYSYDFGDDWRHELEVVRVAPPEKGAKYPICLDGARACPPEDVGGPWGYPNYLEALANPDHEDHEDVMEWNGAEFDPEAFDIKAANRRLRRRKP